MKTINIYEISEETRYVWECPECTQFNEDSEDPDYAEQVVCESCYVVFKIVDN